MCMYIVVAKIGLNYYMGFYGLDFILLYHLLWTSKEILKGVSVLAANLLSTSFSWSNLASWMWNYTLVYPQSRGVS